MDVKPFDFGLNRASGVPTSPTPEGHGDVWKEVGRHLDPLSLTRLGAASKSLHGHLRDNGLWGTFLPQLVAPQLPHGYLANTFARLANQQSEDVRQQLRNRCAQTQQPRNRALLQSLPPLQVDKERVEDRRLD